MNYWSRDHPGIEDVPAVGLDSLLPPLIERAIERGELPASTDRDAALLALVSVFFGVPLLLHGRQAALVEGAYRQQLAIVWAGLAAGPATPPASPASPFPAHLAHPPFPALARARRQVMTAAPSIPPLSRATQPQPRALAERVPSWALLALGAAFTMLTGARFGIAALAWLVPVPYLLFARRIRSWRGWLVLGGVLVGSAAIQWLQIVTPPVPALLILGFAVPLAFGSTLLLALTEAIRRRAGEVVGLYSFAALTAIGDWAGHSHTELGAWATMGNANVTSLPMMQLASLWGLAGLGFLMAWFAGVITTLVGAPEPRQRRRHAIAVGLALLAALGWGSLRLDATHERTVTVAAVVTDLGLDESGMPSAERLAANTDTLFERTRLAAARGARLVVWNEVATVIEPAAEQALIERGRREAQRLGIDLVLGYGVLLEADPLLLDNKYVFLTSEGTVAQHYRKHHPVPGEPSLRGTEPIEAIDRPYARVAGAICYDYDFPELARAHARLGVELVFVPSSDWRGIDPVHTYMARTRAIEGGFSLVRSVRWGASGAFDAHGRTRALMPVTEANDRVMLASVPVGRIETLYTAVGDAPLVGMSGAFLVLAVALAFRRRRRS